MKRKMFAIMMAAMMTATMAACGNEAGAPMDAPTDEVILESTEDAVEDVSKEDTEEDVTVDTENDTTNGSVASLEGGVNDADAKTSTGTEVAEPEGEPLDGVLGNDVVVTGSDSVEMATPTATAAPTAAPTARPVAAAPAPTEAPMLVASAGESLDCVLGDDVVVGGWDSIDAAQAQQAAGNAPAPAAPAPAAPSASGTVKTETSSAPPAVSEPEKAIVDTTPKDTHSHDWKPVYTTVHHDQDVVWVEETVMEWVEVTGAKCLVCGLFNENGPLGGTHTMTCIETDENGVVTKSGSRQATELVQKPVTYSGYELVPAWDEQVQTGWQCSCGATKGMD